MGRRDALVHVLQFLPCSSLIARHARNGSRDHRSHLGIVGPFGVNEKDSFLMYAISMRTTLIALLAIVAVAGLAQNPVDDPGGWTKAKWGMTEDQIRTAFPDADQVKLSSTHLGLPAYNIGLIRFVVAFEFDASGGLGTVTLYDEFTVAGLRRYLDEKQIYQPSGVAAAIERVKDDLLSSLTAKYGKFSDHAITDKGTQDEWLWLFPSTTLKLEWSHAGYSIDGVHLRYSARKKSADL